MGRPRKQHVLALDGTELKHCYACNIWHPLERFGQARDKWDNLANRCRVCQAKATAKSRGVPWRKSTQERTGKYAVAIWGSKSAARAAWRRDHPERDAAIRKRSDEKNRDVIRARDRARRANPAVCAKRNVYNRAYYEADKATRLAQVAQWRIDNPERARIKGVYHRAKRRARQRALPAEPWTEQQIIDRDGLVCWLNGCAVGGTLPSGRRDWAIDHLIPIGVEYPEHPGDTLPNLAIACHPCNITKGARLLPEAIARYHDNVNGRIEPAS